MTRRAQQDEFWKDRAACIDQWDLFFGPDSAEVTGAQEAAARRLCAGCDVASTCAAYAEAHNERAGVWAGVNRERQRHGKRSELQD